MVEPGNSLGKKACDIDTGIPFPCQEILVVYRIRPDNPVKESFPVGLLKKLYGFP